MSSLDLARSDQYMEKGEGGCPYRLGLVGMERIRSITGESKKETPYSGTTVLVDRLGYALAFSKQTIPAIRKEDQARDLLPKSPVRRHVGLYAYSGRALESYFSLPPSVYERSYIEGLEQMRFLENGIKMRVVDVDYRGRETTSGVDSPEDVKRVEEILEKYGEFDLS